MKAEEKIYFLKTNYSREWLRVREEVENRLSASQGVFCVCGKLATGFHELNCRKFQRKVNSETIKKLKYLLKQKNLKTKEEG